MSLALLKKKFQKETKSQIFIFGSIGAGKSSLLKVLQQKLSMKNKGNQNMAGISLETIVSRSEEIYSYNYDKETFQTMTKFIQQSTTKCVIFVIDSRKQYIIKDKHGNDIRSNIKDIAKIAPPECHILILCNKQDVTKEDILSSDEIGKILDISRTFSKNKHSVIGCSLNSESQNNTDLIISYLTDNNIITSILNESDESKTDNHGKISDHKKNSKSFVNIFKKRNNSQKAKHNEVIMIFGLDKVGKTKLMDSFGFGKKSKTSIAIFEAETIKCNNTEFHAWDYEQRSWPMAKSFFIHCSLVIFVIDATKYQSLRSEKKSIWTVEAYLKILLGINGHNNKTDKNNKNKKKNVIMNKNGIPQINENPFVKSVSYDNDNNDEHKEHKNMDNEWPLKCPFLFYINKYDLDEATVTSNDLEEEIQLSRLMKSKGIKHFVQQCSAKTKKGVYDGLVWCVMNGILTSIPQIKQYADKNDIKLPIQKGNK